MNFNHSPAINQQLGSNISNLIAYLGLHVNKNLSDKNQTRCGNKGSLKITRLGFYDFESGSGGNLIELIKQKMNCPVNQAFQIAKDICGNNIKPITDSNIRVNIQKDIPPADRNKKDWSSKAEYIWNKTVNIHGTPVETYLRARGCIVPDSDDLRYLPAYKEKPHAMLARITDAITGAAISLHFTYLKPDGSGKADVEKQKSLLFEHRKKGGVIRLFPDEDVTMGLCITEGIETALTVAKYHNPVWAAVDSSNIAKFPILDGIECLSIFADYDKSGLDAAGECKKRWVAAGKKVKIVPPSCPNTDWNDVERRAGL